MRKKTTIMFDFDGTLMDTNEIIIQSWQHTFRTVAGHEADRNVLLATFGEPLVLTMKNFFGVEGEKAQEYIDIYRNFQKDIFLDAISLFPGVTEMLDQLRDQGYRMALTTSRLKKTTLMAVESFNIGPYFEVIITADDCSRHKPDPEPINVTLAKMGVPKEEAVMVGDTTMDTGCAANAGVTSVLVGWSMALSDPEKRKSANADFIINEPSELLGILNDLNA